MWNDLAPSPKKKNNHLFEWLMKLPSYISLELSLNHYNNKWEFYTYSSILPPTHVNYSLFILICLKNKTTKKSKAKLKNRKVRRFNIINRLISKINVLVLKGVLNIIEEHAITNNI